MSESKIIGVSSRGWLAFIIILTVCVMSYMKIKVEEPLYSLVLLASGFYFGQKTNDKGNSDVAKNP